jgi:hypothetical protein
MTGHDRLDQLLDAAKSGDAISGSVSELCAVGLAAKRHDLLPAPYDQIGEAWRRLNDEQRGWVRSVNPIVASAAAALARHHGEGAPVTKRPDSPGISGLDSL